MPDKIGHYTIVSQLGRGGMGVVYKAHEESLNRYVAIKVLGEHLSEDQAFLTRFVREAQAAAGLSHPNIVQIFFIGDDDGRHYFVMEYVSGRSLHSMIKDEGRVDNPKAAQLMLQAAQGLAAAHDQGIIHRDIKPANLMLDPRGVVKIADFGLALPVEQQTRLTATGMLMGTPGYLAPEQVRNEGADHRTDIYALGVSYFELLTGGVPFKAESPLALIRQIVDEEPPDVTTLNPSVDAESRSILSKMIAKDRSERYQDCHKLVSDLEDYIHSKGVRSATYGLATTTVPGADRPPRTVAADAPTQVTPSAGSSSAPTAVTPTPGNAAAPTEVTPTGEMSEAPTVMTPSEAPTVATASSPTPPPPAAATPPLPPAAPTPAAVPSTAAGPERQRSSKGLLIVAILAFLMVGGAGAAFVAWKIVKGGGLFGGGETARAAAALEETSDDASSGAGPAAASTPDTDDGIDGAADDQPLDGMTPEQGGMTEVSGIRPEAADAKSNREGTRTPPASSAPAQHAASATKKSEAAPPPRSLSGTIVAVSGDPTLTPYVSEIVMMEVSAVGVQAEDASSLPGWDDLMRQDPQTGFLVDQVENAGYATLILVRVDPTGTRELQYMGRYETAYTSRVTIQKYDVATGRPVGQRATATVEYTQINAQREVEKKVGPVARQFANGL